MIKVEEDHNETKSLSQLECGLVSNLSPENSFIVIGHGSMASDEDFDSTVNVHNTIAHQSVSNSLASQNVSNSVTHQSVSDSLICQNVSDSLAHLNISDSLAHQNHCNEPKSPESENKVFSESINKAFPESENKVSPGSENRVSPESGNRVSPESRNHDQEPPLILSSSYVEPKDIQEKLDLVLQENIELKETLNQNNLAMRQQMETLALWQNEVAKVQQGHSEKFQQTKELVIKLKAENSELHMHLEKLQAQIQHCADNKGDGSPKNNIDMSSKTNSDKASQQTDNATDDQNNGVFMTEMELLAKKNALVETLELKCVELTEKRKKVEQHCERLCVENLSLRKQLDGYRSQEGKMEMLNALVQQLTHKLETSERGRRQLEFDVEKAKYSHTDESLLELGNENCALRLTLADRNKEIESLKKAVVEFVKKSEREENREQTRKTDVPVDRQLEVRSDLEALLRQQLEVAQASLLERENRNSDLSRLIQELYAKIDDLETKLEAIPILQAQVEVYQADFHAEREARQEAVSEKENLRRILNSADIRLRSDHAPNNLGSDGNTNEIQNPRETIPFSSIPQTVSCPICSAVFSDVNELERHVDRYSM